MNKQERDQEPSRNIRAGVYICKCGGNISDVIDVERVREVTRLLPGVVTSKVHTFMCSDPGQLMIAEDIEKEKLDRVVVASCSPFLHELTFRHAVERGGLNPYLYEHVNIREQGSWAHKDDPEGATSTAIRMIAAALGKLHNVDPLDKIMLSNNQKALVIGGGVAGMKAALDLGERGIPVILVEKASCLGGNLNDLDTLYPTESEARSLVESLRAGLASRSSIEVLTDAEVTGVSGFVGNFDVTIRLSIEDPSTNSREAVVTVGTIVVATGFIPYAPREGELGFGRHPGVVTLPDFIRFLADQGTGKNGQLLWEGRPVRNIAFIHCVGSRQVDGVHEPQKDGQINTYCSRTCCTAVLQQALKVRQRFPGVNVFDLHQDIRTYGYGQEEYYINTSKEGVVFLRYHGDEPPVVEAAPGAGRREPPLRVTLKDWLTWGEEITVPADLVVLAVGMMPSRISEIIDMMKLPVGADRFLQEVHPKLRPVEVSVDGVLLAGTSQAPMNVEESLLSAQAAAAKASTMLFRESVEIDPFVAEVNEDLCDGTGLCINECEYSGAITLVEKQLDGVTVKRAVINPGLCKGCGSCVPVCPHRAIDIKGNTLGQFEAMVDAIAADLPEAAEAAS